MNRSLHLLDHACGDVCEWAPGDDAVCVLAGRSSADRSGVYGATHDGREFADLRRFELAGSKRGWVEAPERDIQSVAGWVDGAARTWIENDDPLRLQPHVARPA
jgi:hypothetical protein